MRDRHPRLHGRRHDADNGIASKPPTRDNAQRMGQLLHCYAEGRDGAWEAFCLDLDLAVQGETFEEVYHSLAKAIELYVDSVSDLPERDRTRLLNRPAPLSLRLRFVWMALKEFLFGRSGPEMQHQFTLPTPA